MRPESLYFAEDYLRVFAWQDRRFMMELFAPAIREATGLLLCPLIDTVGDRPALSAFRERAPGTWEQNAARLPDVASAWLERRLSPGACVVSYEMPGWLRVFLDERHIPWVDIRLSPLRFSLDLMLAVRSSDARTMRWLFAGEISWTILRQEAIKMGSSARRLMRLREPGAEARYDNSLVFTGQTAEDASLLRADGYRLTVADFAAELRGLAAGRTHVFYHPHPYAGEHAVTEYRVLADILDRNILHTRCETYELLSASADILLTGISSGLLQEAEWFDRESRILHRPVCPLDGADAWAQYYLNDLMNPAFWSATLSQSVTGYQSTEGCADELRKLHALWFTHDLYLLERGPSPLRHPLLAGELARTAQRLTGLETRWQRLTDSRLYRAAVWCRRILSKS